MRRVGTSIQVLCNVIAAVGILCEARIARATEPVAVELVLAVDTSVSVNMYEYHLQMSGIARAFRSPSIVKIIADQPGGVAVTLVHWSLGSLNRQAVEWSHLNDLASVMAFSKAVEQVPRDGAGRGTSIGDAITYSVGLIEGNAFEGAARKIDISGDSRSNSGPSPHFARDIAVAKNITVNGLTIPDGDRDLVSYFRALVIGGEDAFVLTANRYSDFATAMQFKLERELNVLLSENLAGSRQ